MGRTRTAGIALLCALLHLLALTWLARGPATLQLPAGAADVPAMDVALLRWPQQPAERPATRAPAAGAPSPAKPLSTTATAAPETAPKQAAAPIVSETTKAGVGCDREIRLLLTPQEREACDTAAAVAASGKPTRFERGRATQEISRIPLDRSVEFEAAMAEKRSRRDMNRAAAQLAAAEAEAARRRAPAWTGQGQGADVSIRFDCAVKFSGLRPGRPKCRLSGGVSP